jgi:hypothetical protein
MDSRVWQRYVAVVCSQAWNLNVYETEEVVRCVEALVAAAPVTGSAAVRVLLGTGIGELAVDPTGEKVRIGIRR